MPTVTATSFYQDWTFWSFVIASLALLLSQLPHVRLWFKPKRLEVEVRNRVLVTHTIGNPNVSLLVTIRNSGGRALRISGVDIQITRDGLGVGILPCQSYFETGTQQSANLFVPFSLPPGSDWTKTLNFGNLFDRHVESAFRASRNAIKTDIEQKAAQNPPGPGQYIEAEPALIVPITDLFERLFMWHRGEYVLTLNVRAEGTKNFRREYRFTLYDADVSDLRDHAKLYRYGAGVYFNDSRQEAAGIPLTEHVRA